MKIYLNTDGTWGIEGGLEGIHTYEALPEVVKRVLNLALVMLPYGEFYSPAREDEAEKAISLVTGIDDSNFGIYTYLETPTTPYEYYIELYNTKLLKRKRAI